MKISIDALNNNQLTAVRWNDGPMLALAGPGSGKTTVLTVRIARILKESDDLAILALTFTKKAATEMRGRVNQLLGARTNRARLCTFHSFAADMLRQHGSHVGLRPDFVVLGQDEDRVAVLDEVIASLTINSRTIPSDRKNILSIIDRLLAEGYKGQAEAPIFAETPEWVPIVFNSYVNALVSSNRTDYGTLISQTCKLLRGHSAVARAVRLGWTHICVDEFQDTNKAQYEILRLLAPEPRANLFVVADDDQILFQWNGASPERLRTLTSDYDVELVQLPENYRCPGQIVNLANKLIVHNRRRAIGKMPLAAAQGTAAGPDVVRYLAYPTLEDESAAVAADMKMRGLDPSTCVVLARTRKVLESFAVALRSAGFEAYVARRKAEFERPLARVMFQVLRLANAPHDRESLRRLCVAWEKLTDVEVEMESVAAASGVVGGHFLRAWSNTVAGRGTARAQRFVHQVHQLLVDRLEFPGIVDWFLGEGSGDWDVEDDDELTAEFEVWRGLHDDVVAELGPGNLTLHGYLQHMALIPKTASPGPSAVRCLTVHGAKGLEFWHVYLVGLAQEVLPSYQALKRDSDSRALEEERRSCFVAVTRTQKSLTITRARQYFNYNKAPSQFLAEMGINETTRAS